MQIIRFVLRGHEGCVESPGLAPSPSAPAQGILNVLISEERPPISHPLAVRAKRLLSKRRKDERGILIPEYRFISPLRVSANALPRAVRLLDALLFASTVLREALQKVAALAKLTGEVTEGSLGWTYQRLTFAASPRTELPSVAIVPQEDGQPDNRIAECERGHDVSMTGARKPWILEQSAPVIRDPR